LLLSAFVATGKLTVVGSLREHFVAMARNNAWANHRLYEVCIRLSDAERRAAAQQDAPPAGPGVREAGAQRAELGLAPDEGDAVHARRDARRSPSAERAIGGLFIVRLCAGGLTAPGHARS
jgi:hypothetical protein